MVGAGARWCVRSAVLPRRCGCRAGAARSLRWVRPLPPHRARHSRRAGGPAAGTDALEAALFYVKEVSMLFYHALDHYAWFAYTAGPTVVDPQRADRASGVSCMLWAAWILAEGVCVERQRHTAVAASVGRGGGDAGAAAAAAARQARMLRAYQANLCADLALALHWSRTRGIGLSDLHIGLLGLASALLGLWRKWVAMK